MSRFFAFARTALIGLLLIQAGACAADGLLDPTYGSAGYARLTGTTGVGPQALVVRPNGSSVFAASRPTTSRDIVVGALSADGRPDGTFAGGGLLQIATAGTLYRPLLLRDPRTNTTLLAASDYRGGAYRLMVCRILDSGALDFSFSAAGYSSQAGCVSVDPPAFAPSGTLPAGMAVTGSGTIVLGGSAYDFGNNSFRAFYASFTPLDVGSSGVSISVVPSVSSVFINAVAVAPNGQDIYYTGFQRPGSDASLIVIRLGTSSVSSYLHNPNVVTNAMEDGRAIVVRNSNEIYVAGTVETAGGKSDCVLIRLDGSLQPVSAFGPAGNGRRSIRFVGGAGDSASCDAIQVDAQGVVTVGGRVGTNNDQFFELAAAKLTNFGDYVADFNNGGVARVNPGLNPSRSERTLAMGLHNGRVLLAGPSDLAVGATPQTTDMVVVRLSSSDVIFSNGFN